MRWKSRNFCGSDSPSATENAARQIPAGPPELDGAGTECYNLPTESDQIFWNFRKEIPGRTIMPPRTLYEKIWEAHLVHEEPGQPSLIYIDRHLVHEGTSPQAFAGLKASGRKVRRPELTFAVMDHSVSTKSRALPILDPEAAAQMEAL